MGFFCRPGDSGSLVAPRYVGKQNPNVCSTLNADERMQRSLRKTHERLKGSWGHGGAGPCTEPKVRFALAENRPGDGMNLVPICLADPQRTEVADLCE